MEIYAVLILQAKHKLDLSDASVTQFLPPTSATHKNFLSRACKIYLISNENFRMEKFYHKMEKFGHWKVFDWPKTPSWIHK